MSNFKTIFSQGKSFALKKDWHSAFHIYSHLLTLENISSSEKSIAYSNRSEVSLNLAKFENAENDALKIIELNPKWFLGYLRAGNASLASNKIDDALKYFKDGFGKEGDNGTLPQLYSQTYFRHKFHSRMTENHKYYSEVQEFKQNYFVNQDRAMAIYENLKLQTDINDKDGFGRRMVCREINTILLDNCDFLIQAQKEMELLRSYTANLYLWEAYRREQNPEKKASIYKTILHNFDIEARLLPNQTISFIMSTLKSQNCKHQIELNTLINLFWEHLHHYYDMHYEKTRLFLEKVNNNGKEWILNRKSPKINQENLPRENLKE